MLGYPTIGGKYILDTDASSHSVGAVLSQLQWGGHYLLGRKFLLRTDHASLTWLFQFKCLEGQLARWLEELSQYDSTVAMSRQATDYSNECDCNQAGKNLSDLPCQGCKYCQRLHEQWARFENDVVPLAMRSIQTSVNTSGPSPSGHPWPIPDIQQWEQVRSYHH